MPNQANIWLWDAANEVWVKAPAVVVSKRMTATGQVISGAHKLYWIEINPSAGSSVFELTDATAGGGTVLYDCFHTARESHVHEFHPPMPFSTGIYLETFTNMTSVIFGYI